MDCLWKSWTLTAAAPNRVSGSAYQHGKCFAAKMLPLHLGLSVVIGAEIALPIKDVFRLPGSNLSWDHNCCAHADIVHGILSLSLTVSLSKQVSAHKL